MDRYYENGRFFDNAMELVLNAIPAPDKQTLKDYIRGACAELNRRGITSCHSDDYCVFRQIPWQTVNEAYRELESEGALTVRVREQVNLTTVPDLMEFLHRFGEKKRTIPLTAEIRSGHGGGDYGILWDFLHILRHGGESRTSANISLQSHLICFAAEKSRTEHIVVEL